MVNNRSNPNTTHSKLAKYNLKINILIASLFKLQQRLIRLNRPNKLKPKIGRKFIWKTFS